jgi:hypothetical protein
MNTEDQLMLDSGGYSMSKKHGLFFRLVEECPCISNSLSRLIMASSRAQKKLNSVALPCSSQHPHRGCHDPLENPHHQECRW